VSVGQYYVADKSGVALSPLAIVQNIRFGFTARKLKKSRDPQLEFVFCHCFEEVSFWHLFQLLLPALTIAFYSFTLHSLVGKSLMLCHVLQKSTLDIL
jgi:hypothetical protein